jgi:RNA polymerase sigma-70 factor (ECF subfamily)
VNRYRRAIFRYLVATVKDPELAEELGQELALKFLQGDFHPADPAKGRFRDYVKTTLINLVRKHFRNRKQGAIPLPEQLEGTAGAVSDAESAEFDLHWRQELLDQTWERLEARHVTAFRILRLKLAQPDMTSRELAERYTAKHGEPMTSGNVRKSLERAHRRFADLLVQELATQLTQPDRHQLRSELRDLDLLKYCQSAVERWKPDAS